METQNITRVFTRADIEQLVAKSFADIKDFTYAIESVSLLPGLTPPAWIVRYVFIYYAGTPREIRYDNSFILYQRNDYESPYLYFVVEDELPEGLATPADEDAEVARRKAEKHAAWLRKQGQDDASAS